MTATQDAATLRAAAGILRTAVKRRTLIMDTVIRVIENHATRLESK